MENYSKWDKFVAELSDGSDDVEDNYPNVTKFDKEGGETIEIGKGGYKIKQDINESNLQKKEELVNDTKKENKNMVINNETLNGCACDEFYWSQDRYEVKLSIYINDDTIKSKDISISYEKKRFIVKSKVNMFVIIEKEFQYDIEINDTKNFVNSEFDWEIKSKELHNDKDNLIEFKRVIEFTFRKKSPIPGAFIWWSNVFIGDKKIDVSNLTGRKSESNDKNMQAWNEAHKLFMDKVANREKVEVDCEDT